MDNDEAVIHRAALCPQTPQTSIGYDIRFNVKTDRPNSCLLQLPDPRPRPPGLAHRLTPICGEPLRKKTAGGSRLSVGDNTYPEARELLITADGGGSNGSRVRLWKVALQRMADATGLKISVCHFPPGTSKWNKIEHRMFCHITRNWRGRPLESHEVIVNLIASTTTTKGLRVRAALDTDEYPTGVKVEDATMTALHLIPDKFHGDWNYTMCPSGKPA